MEYTFIFNLEKGEAEDEDPSPSYAIKYYNPDSGEIVELGDGYRHEMFIEGDHWNRILRIIKNKELDEKGIEAIIGLMSEGLRKEYTETFISAVRSEIIKEI